MPLSLRTLTNAGDPLCTADGQVLSGVRVSFQLVDSYGVATTSWDALTHETVVGEPIVATTDEDGEFSVDLWPNSRGNPPTRYRCTVDHPAFKAFSGTVDDLSLGPLQWVEFMAASATLEPQDLGEMSLYRQELAAGLQTLGTAVGVAGASATASQGSASAAAAAQSAAAASAATASTQAGAAADAAGQSASSASTASTQAGVASTQAGQAATSATLAQQWATRTDDEVAAGQGYGARKYALDAASSASAASNAASAAAATVSDLQTALSGKVDASDPRLSDAREWTAATVTQPEAEAGTATTRRAWTAQRVFQAVAAWWAGSAAKTKLDGIATGATANATDAALRDRTTHTGTQAASTIAGLDTALAGKADASVTLTDDPGTPTLPATAAAPIASRLQVLRNNVKQVFADLAGKANASHNHAQGDVTGLQTALDAKIAGPASSVDGQVMVFDGATGKKAKSGGVLGDSMSLKGRYTIVATDTRSEFPVPYDNLLVRYGARLEFKGLNMAVKDAPGITSSVPTPTGSYMNVLTMTPWGDVSGGMPMQIGMDTTSARLFLRAGNGTYPASEQAGPNANNTWVAGKTIASNGVIHATPGKQTYFYFRALSGGGVTGSVEPVWPTTSGDTVVDGTVTWTATPHWTPWRNLVTASYNDISAEKPNLCIDSSGNVKRSTVGLVEKVNVPASASAPGTVGQIAYDSSYFYVCDAANSWKRTAISSW